MHTCSDSLYTGINAQNLTNVAGSLTGQHGRDMSLFDAFPPTGSVRPLRVQGAAEVLSLPPMSSSFKCIKMSQRREVIDLVNHCISFATLFAQTGALYVNMRHFRSAESTHPHF